MMQLIKLGEFVTPYHLRPAFAINLAELVLDENEVDRIYCIYCKPTLGSKNALRHIRYLLAATAAIFIWCGISLGCLL